MMMQADRLEASKAATTSLRARDFMVFPNRYECQKDCEAGRVSAGFSSEAGAEA